MDAAGPVDAKTAPTGPWKTAQTAVSHSAHTHSRSDGEDEINRPHTKFLTLPKCAGGGIGLLVNFGRTLSYKRFAMGNPLANLPNLAPIAKLEGPDDEALL